MPIFLNGVKQGATESTGDITIVASSIEHDATQTDGATISHNTTLEVLSNLAVYEANMSDGSFTTKEYVDDELVLKVDEADRNVNNGYAGLDAFGHVPIEHLPPAVLGTSSYLGVWHANTNTPTIANGTGNNGDYYRVDEAGTQNLGGGAIEYHVGDVVVYDTADNTWHRIGDEDHDASTISLVLPFVPVTGVDVVGTDTIQNALEKLQGNVTELQEIEHIHPLQEVMNEGSTAVAIPGNVSIQTNANMTLTATGTMALHGSSTSQTATGAHTQTFDHAVITASITDGCQVDHGTTVKVLSDLSTYESNMSSGSFVTKDYLESQLSPAGAAGGAIGDVKASMLTAAQMTAIDATWHIADGSGCSGSDYHTLTGNATVPDLRGQFIRGFDPTAIVDPDGASRTLGDSQADMFKAHSHTQSMKGTGYDPPANGIGGVNGSLPNWPVNPTDSTGGDETRPVNIAMNYFIKINN